MAETKKKLHIVMFPWLAFGHLSPYLELAKLIAQKGHRVSYVSTTRNIERLPKLPQNLTHLLDMVKLTLPHEENLPKNAEITMDVPEEKGQYLVKAYDGLQESLTQFLEASRPDWILYDFAPHWLSPIAADLGISRAFFSIFKACALSFLQPTLPELTCGAEPYAHTNSECLGRPKWIPFPTNLRVRLFEVKKMFNSLAKNATGISDSNRMQLVFVGCDAIIIRGCKETEADWLNLLGELHGKPIVPVGLLPPSIQITEDDKDNNTMLQINKWLDNHDKGSVVYVAFGSELTPTADELNQLALGLELSGLPFFWALRKRFGSREYECYELPDGFEERIKHRGVIWTSWAPQLRILSHESVGGFLTHCGWSSIIEALQFGRPLIMFPCLGDQGLNSRHMEEQKVGIEIARDEEDGSLTSSSVAEALRLIMVDEEGKTYRDKAKEMMSIYGNKELNDRYVDDLLEFLQDHNNHARNI